jgi:hypothetical protein
MLSWCERYRPVLLHPGVPKNPEQPMKLELFAFGYPYAEKSPNGAMSVMSMIVS